MAHILIVDDDLDIVKLLQVALQGEGHRVSVAHDGAEALRVLGLEPENPRVELPDLVLLDVVMPHVDGYTVNSHLYKTEWTKQVPVIIMTGRKEMHDLFAFATQDRLFVAKPFDYRNLAGHIAHILRHKG